MSCERRAQDWGRTAGGLARGRQPVCAFPGGREGAFRAGRGARRNLAAVSARPLLSLGHPTTPDDSPFGLRSPVALPTNLAFLERRVGEPA